MIVRLCREKSTVRIFCANFGYNVINISNSQKKIHIESFSTVVTIYKNHTNCRYM